MSNTLIRVHSMRDFVAPAHRERERDLINSGKLRRAVVHLVKRDFPTCRMQKRICRTSASRTGQARACKHTADRNRVLILIARPKCIWLHDDTRKDEGSGREVYRR